MSRNGKNRQVMNLDPNGCMLEWESDAPILVFTEYRSSVDDNGNSRIRTIVVRVALDLQLAAHLGHQLHAVRKEIDQRALRLLQALKGPIQ
jgi:hypothetical protein